MFNSLLANSLWGDIVNFFVPSEIEDATTLCTTVMLWIAIALVVAFIVCKLAVKKEYQHKVNVVSLIVALVFSVACIVTFAACSFSEDEIVAITFYPLLVLAIVCVLGALAGGVYAGRKLGVRSLLSGVGVGAVLFLLLMTAGLLAYEDASLERGGIGILCACLCGGALAGLLTARRPKKKRKR